MSLTFSKQYFFDSAKKRKSNRPKQEQINVVKKNIACNIYVSFEDSETVATSSLSLDKSSVNRKKSLKRQFSSMCLVELAGESTVTTETTDDEECIVHVTTSTTNNNNSTSCWDHFVDIIPPEEYYCNYKDNDDNYIQTFFSNESITTISASSNKSSLLSTNPSSSSSLEHSIKRLRVE